MDLGTIIHALFALIFILGFAYLIWATAAKADGQLQSAGNLLAILVAAAGVLFVVAMLTAPMMGGRPFGIDMHRGGTPAATPAPSGGEAATPAPGGGETPTESGGTSSGGPKPGGKP